MKPRFLSLISLTLSLLPVMRAQNTAPNHINPALLYWQAAAELPKLSDDLAKTLSAMAFGRQPFDAAKIKEMDFPYAEHLLVEAANSTAPCEWGLAMEDGPEAPLPHLSKVQQLASIAILRAETLLAEGKTREGLEWLLISHHIARDAGAGRLLISYLVQTSLEVSTLRAAARRCLAWDESTRHEYAAKLKSLPPAHTLQESFRGELALVDWFERVSRLAEPERQQKLKQIFAAMAPSPTDKDHQGHPAEKETFLEQSKPESMMKAAAELHALFQKTLIALGNPRKECQAELDALKDAAVRSEFAWVRLSYPVVAAPIVDKVYAALTLHTMLNAALDHGPQLDEASAATYHDAFEGQPLRLKKSPDGGLSLIAAEQHPKGKDIELKLGK